MLHSSGRWRARVPAAEVVAEGEDPLLGPRALLVAARAAEGRVEAVLLDRVEQRRRLQPVARRARAGLLDDAAVVDRLLHGGDDQPLAELGDAAVAEVDDLREVVPRVDVHEREREARRAERLLGQAQQHDRVLAAAEQQHRLLELGGDLAHDVDRLGLEGLEVSGRAAHATAPPEWRDAGRASGRRRRHADRTPVLSVPAQRPSRPSPGCVHGAQPIDA